MGVALFERRIHESPDDRCRIPCTRPFRLPPRPERRGRLQRLEEPVVRRERQQLFPEQPEQPERRRERQQQRQLEQHAEEPERPQQRQQVTAHYLRPAPAVVEFDAAGNYLRGWGAPADAKAEWPKSEHGIYIDPQGNVWIAGNGDEDNQILKFTPAGRFLMQIGRAGKSEGSASRVQLGRPAHMVMDERTRELY